MLEQNRKKTCNSLIFEIIYKPEKIKYKQTKNKLYRNKNINRIIIKNVKIIFNRYKRYIYKTSLMG